MGEYRTTVRLTLAEILTFLTEVNFLARENLLGSPGYKDVVDAVVDKVYAGWGVEVADHSNKKQVAAARQTLSPQQEEAISEEVIKHVMGIFAGSEAQQQAYELAMEELDTLKRCPPENEEQMRQMDKALSEWLGRQEGIFGKVHSMERIFVLLQIAPEAPTARELLEEVLKRQARPELQ